MNEWLGDLWHFPFRADVWGTGAAWFGAVGTVVSVGLAVYFYRNNQLQEQKAQARHIVFSEANDYADSVKLYVSNFSDESIFDITVGKTYEHTFRSVVENQCRRQAHEHFFDPDPDQVSILPEDEVERLRDNWTTHRRIGSELIVQPFTEGHLKAGKTKEFLWHEPYDFTARYWLRFRDSMARKWEYTLGDPEPTQLAWEPCKWWHIFMHPRCYLEQRKKRQSFETWLDRCAAPPTVPNKRPPAIPQRDEDDPRQS